MDLSSEIAQDLIRRGADPDFLANLVIPPIPEGQKLSFEIVSPQEYRACCVKLVKLLIPIIEQHIKDTQQNSQEGNGIFQRHSFSHDYNI